MGRKEERGNMVVAQLIILSFTARRKETPIPDQTRKEKTTNKADKNKNIDKINE